MLVSSDHSNSRSALRCSQKYPLRADRGQCHQHGRLQQRLGWSWRRSPIAHIPSNPSASSPDTCRRPFGSCGSDDWVLDQVLPRTTGQRRHLRSPDVTHDQDGLDPSAKRDHRQPIRATRRWSRSLCGIRCHGVGIAPSRIRRGRSTNEEPQWGTCLVCVVAPAWHYEEACDLALSGVTDGAGRAARRSGWRWRTGGSRSGQGHGDADGFPRMSTAMRKAPPARISRN